MAKPITFKSWFAVPRSLLRKNNDEPQTAFEQISSPETRLYLHLLKLRKPYHGSVQIRNTDLESLAGLDDRTLRRARKKLVKHRLIEHVPIDARKETHLYTFIEAGATLLPFDGPEEYDESNLPPTTWEIIPIDVVSALNPVATLRGRQR